MDKGQQLLQMGFSEEEVSTAAIINGEYAHTRTHTHAHIILHKLLATINNGHIFLASGTSFNL